jgi:bacterioferritin (cytochrome b1)
LKARIEGEERLIRFIDEKFAMLQGDLNHEGHARDKDLDNASRAVEENLSKISEAVRIANIEREENDADILKKIGEGLQLISQKVAVDRQQRESSEQGIYDLLKDVVARVKVSFS